MESGEQVNEEGGGEIVSGDYIHAVYEGGVFKPVEPVDLPEHCQVKVEPIDEHARGIDTIAAEEFWIEKSLDQLATEQDVHIVSDWTEISGSARELWESDESFKSFLIAAIK